MTQFHQKCSVVIYPHKLQYSRKSHQKRKKKRVVMVRRFHRPLRQTGAETLLLDLKQETSPSPLQINRNIYVSHENGRSGMGQSAPRPVDAKCITFHRSFGSGCMGTSTPPPPDPRFGCDAQPPDAPSRFIWKPFPFPGVYSRTDTVELRPVSLS